LTHQDVVMYRLRFWWRWWSSGHTNRSCTFTSVTSAFTSRQWLSWCLIRTERRFLSDSDERFSL